jgi:hypothetical protein
MIQKIKSILKKLISVKKDVKVLKISNKIKNVIKKPYRSIPAPHILPDDPWFGSSIKTQKGLDIQKQIDHNKEVERQTNLSKESENIHQEMYELATKNWNTVKETQGGSENFQEGSSSVRWQSGTGYGQFRG